MQQKQTILGSRSYSQFSFSLTWYNSEISRKPSLFFIAYGYWKTNKRSFSLF